VEDQGDVDARPSTFEEFYRHSWPAVFRTAYLIAGDSETARDLAQEAFERAFSHWRKVSVMDRPEAWVHRVVANLALSWRRRQRLARSRVPPAPSEALNETEEVVPMVVTALRALPVHQRAVVVLRYYADFSIEQTAQALGKRPATVRSLAAQGIARLRSILIEQEVSDG
jgi:RNA polymerase sigma-70 factor (sigma-E family)